MVKIGKQRLLLIACGNVESNLGTGSNKVVRVLYSNICGLHANLSELAVAGLNYVLVCAKSKVSDHCHLSELHIAGFGCPQHWLHNSTLVPSYGSLC